jgi:hypothetical protein
MRLSAFSNFRVVSGSNQGCHVAYRNSPLGSPGGSRMLHAVASRLGVGSVSVVVSGVGGVAVSVASLAAKGFVSRIHVLVQTRHGCLLGPSTAEMRLLLQHGHVLVSLFVCLVSVRFKWLQLPHNPPGVRMKSVPSQFPGHVTWAHRIISLLRAGSGLASISLPRSSISVCASRRIAAR